MSIIEWYTFVLCVVENKVLWVSTAAGLEAYLPLAEMHRSFYILFTSSGTYPHTTWGICSASCTDCFIVELMDSWLLVWPM